ncbi:sensor histidine kinase [Nocardioides limicola]|uniref:sensor histidine kinase n=1 Tax=Nocardioides limicola TaxID=2803368 RepID=UPI00193B4930|nr:sensor histidine kinase [Nocardioides sp. DJM-14]
MNRRPEGVTSDHPGGVSPESGRSAVDPGRVAGSPRATAGRSVVVLACVATVAYAIARTPTAVRRFSAPCREELCSTFEQPTSETLALLESLRMSETSWALVVILLCWATLALSIGVALALVRHAPDQPVSLVTSFLVLATAAGPFGGEERGWVLVAVGALVVVFLGLFPTGTWSPRWLRWAWPGVVGLFAAREVIGRFGPEGWEAANLAFDLVFVAYVLGVPVHRYLRVSDWTARQQSKWPLLGIVVLVANQCLAIAAGLGGWLGAVQMVLVVVDYGAIGLIVLGVGLALMKHRLYDVDVVVRRATVYAVALVLVAGVYVATVAVASVVISGVMASLLGALIVGLLGLLGGLAAFQARGRLRTRLLGSRATPGAAAAELARTISPASGGAENLAASLASVMASPYVAVLDAEGVAVSDHGTPCQRVHRHEVLQADGLKVGEVHLCAPEGRARLTAADQRTLHEVLPFVSLVLLAEEEARELKEARATAATAREDERRRLRSDLHDGVGPLLATQLLAMDKLKHEASQRGEPVVELEQLDAMTHEALAEIRRIAHDLRPAALDAGGLAVALRTVADRFTGSGLPVEVSLDIAHAEISAAVEVAVLRIVQESLTNAARHGAATHCTVGVLVADGAVHLSVIDDGRGLGDAVPGAGMTSMLRRAQELGGEFATGPAAGGGTCVRARIPL